MGIVKKIFLHGASSEPVASSLQQCNAEEYNIQAYTHNAGMYLHARHFFASADNRMGKTAQFSIVELVLTLGEGTGEHRVTLDALFMVSQSITD